jgi:nucleotide-binding universal stress UspA family protein
MKAQKQILVAFDGSKAAMQSVHYLSRITALAEEKVVLYHVYSPLPEYYWDMEGYSDPVLYSDRLREATAWERQSKTIIEEKLAAAQRVLSDAGFHKNRVKLKIVKRRVGFARDIIEEARDGYDLVVLGRKGTSDLAPAAFGGVAFKLLQKLDFLPMLLVGDVPAGKKALLAIDGSTCATATLHSVGTWLVESGFEVTLIHVIRVRGPEKFMQIASKWGEEIVKAAEEGFSTKQIATKIVSGQRSRAEAILHEADQGGFATIVVGRKGLSDVKIFYTGRVCHKIVQSAREQAIWIGT